MQRLNMEVYRHRFAVVEEVFYLVKVHNTLQVKVLH